MKEIKKPAEAMRPARYRQKLVRKGLAEWLPVRTTIEKALEVAGL
jgi:hypothetical protein